LGTCWIGAFYQDQVKDILDIPDEIKVVDLMPLGYPADPSVQEKRRMSVDEIVRYDSW
jgi:nitroreductase